MMILPLVSDVHTALSVAGPEVVGTEGCDPRRAAAELSNDDCSLRRPALAPCWCEPGGDADSRGEMVEEFERRRLFPSAGGLGWAMRQSHSLHYGQGQMQWNEENVPGIDGQDRPHHARVLRQLTHLLEL
jgi:hypothetical protein